MKKKIRKQISMNPKKFKMNKFVYDDNFNVRLDAKDVAHVIHTDLE